jgi:hypothetical protein
MNHWPRGTPGASQVIVDHPRFVLMEIDGRRAIRCKTCGKTSYNPTDAREGYCGFCHVFHLDPKPPERAEARA